MDEKNQNLGAIFRRLIRNTGPISLSQFMGESNARYYDSRDPLGSSGDFVTAPEISQMFGELIGLWLADMWIAAGRPDYVQYVEMGPGRGTLAKDAMRAAARYGFAPQVNFVESSTELKKVQEKAEPSARWHDDLSTLPMDVPLVFVANEFLDALPVRQLVRTEPGWRERMIGLDGERFVFAAGGQPMDAAVPVEWRDAEVGTILETNPGAAATLYEVAGRLAEQGGAALFIDYGFTKLKAGSTMQAVRQHQKVDPLAEPGTADLTALVDFDTLERIARSRDIRVLGTAEQGAWLRALGIDSRAQALAEKAPHYAAEIEASRARLVAADQMGSLFKVLGLAAPDWPGGAGFSSD
ncbi:SAM-dependent methyltransferase [Altererythrobacter sp.]|nr:SAM-dependent methyltransferase [Altererythrobacter sp.]